MGHVSSKIILSEAERVYNSLDVKNRGYITVMDLMLYHHGANKRKAKFLQKVLQHIYSESMTKEYKLPKQDFLKLFVAKATSEKSCLIEPSSAIDLLKTLIAALRNPGPQHMLIPTSALCGLTTQIMEASQLILSTALERCFRYN